jgi:hypothetical protein
MCDRRQVACTDPGGPSPGTTKHLFLQRRRDHAVLRPMSDEDGIGPATVRLLPIGVAADGVLHDRELELGQPIGPRSPADVLPWQAT